jgi:hypothetical protein
MHKPLQGTPDFNEAAFRNRTGNWLVAQSTTPNQRVVIEWSTNEGPSVYVYPAGDRASGFNVTQNVKGTSSDERWADFLEFEFIPKVVRALEADGYKPDVICVDLRPRQVQRARRREIEAAAKAKSGVPINNHLTPDHASGDRRGGAGI